MSPALDFFFMQPGRQAGTLGILYCIYNRWSCLFIYLFTFLLQRRIFIIIFIIVIIIIKKILFVERTEGRRECQACYLLYAGI